MNVRGLSHLEVFFLPSEISSLPPCTFHPSHPHYNSETSVSSGSTMILSPLFMASSIAKFWLKCPVSFSYHRNNPFFPKSRGRVIYSWPYPSYPSCRIISLLISQRHPITGLITALPSMMCYLSAWPFPPLDCGDFSEQSYDLLSHTFLLSIKMYPSHTS